MKYFYSVIAILIIWEYPIHAVLIGIPLIILSVFLLHIRKKNKEANRKDENARRERQTYMAKEWERQEYDPYFKKYISIGYDKKEMHNILISEGLNSTQIEERFRYIFYKEKEEIIKLIQSYEEELKSRFMNVSPHGYNPNTEEILCNAFLYMEEDRNSITLRIESFEDKWPQVHGVELCQYEMHKALNWPWGDGDEAYRNICDESLQKMIRHMWSCFPDDKQKRDKYKSERLSIPLEFVHRRLKMKPPCLLIYKNPIH